MGKINESWCVLRRGYRSRAFDRCKVFCQGEKMVDMYGVLIGRL
jgi:hypothetical protein